jgi:hypothetical protein
LIGGRARPAGARALAVALFLAAGSCVTEARVDSPRGGRAAEQVAPSLDVRESDGGPPVVVIAREGDPEPTVALALHGDVTSEEAAVLSEVFSERLGALDVSVRTRADRRSVIVLLSAAVDLERALASLHEPIERGPWTTRAAGWLTRIPAEGTPSARALADCEGRAGRDGPSLDPASPAGLATLERARRQLVAPDRAAVAVVAGRELADDVAQTIEDFAWAEPLGALAAASTTEPAPHVVEHVPAGGPLVEVALRAVDPTAALRAAAELEVGRSPLEVHAARLGLRVRRAAASIDPRGGCVALQLEAAALPADDALAEWLALARADLARREPFDAGEMIRARDAADRVAEVAAWWALSRRAPPRTSAVLVVRTHGDRGPRDLDAALRRRESSGSGPRPTVQRRLERGHTEDWLVVASPCAGPVAGVAQYGAAWLAAAAAGTREWRDGVVVEPFLSGGAVGFLARAPAPADPRVLATRATAAFFAPPPPLPARLEAWGSLHTALTERFGIADEALSAAAAAGGPWVEPFALPRDAPRLDEEALLAALRAVAEGPLAIAAIGSFEDLDGAADQVARFRPLGAPSACPSPPALPAQRIELGAAPGRAAVVAILQPSGHADAVAALLRRARAPELAGLVEGPARADVEVVSRGRSDVVLFTLRGAPEIVQGRAAQLEGALAALAGVAEEELSEAVGSAEREQRMRSAPLRGRLGALLRLAAVSTPGAPPTPAELRAVLVEPLVARPLTFVARPR